MNRVPLPLRLLGYTILYLSVVLAVSHLINDDGSLIILSILLLSVYLIMRMCIYTMSKGFRRSGLK